MLPKNSIDRRGTALILVFWCLLLLGMTVFGVVEIVQLSVEHTSHEEEVVEARALASSGVALGLNPQLLRNDPLLAQKRAGGGRYKVAISNEGARLNLNYVLLNGHREILENLFVQWGLEPSQAEHAADSLYDWVTPGDLKSLNGAKASDYAHAGLKQGPTHQPFNSFEEVEQVMGLDVVARARPDWKESFTLWSRGPLNINEAPPELIAAVLGISLKRAVFFASARNGKDDLAGTQDDVTIPDVNTVQKQLGIDDFTMQSVTGQLSFSDPTRRIESIGQTEGAQVIISVVSRLENNSVHYFLWSEQ